MKGYVVLLPLLPLVWALEFSKAGAGISPFYGVLLPLLHQVTAGEFSKAGAPVFHNCHVLLYDRPLQHDNMCVPPSPPLYSL